MTFVVGETSIHGPLQGLIYQRDRLAGRRFQTKARLACLPRPAGVTNRPASKAYADRHDLMVLKQIEYGLLLA